MIRFIKRVHGKQKDDQTEQGELTVIEMEAAELMWIQQCQWESFPDEMRSLLGKLPLPSSSRLLQLSPSLDDNGVLILKGRLDNFPEGIRCAKQPFILDGRHPYTHLLVAHYHKKMGHLGREAVVNELRQRYWIIGIRTVVMKTWLQCQHCKNRRDKTSQVKDASCRDRFVTPEVYHAPYTSQDLGGVFGDEVKYMCVVGVNSVLL
jgi:hypothetical protein